MADDKKIQHLIINSPYDKPDVHLKYNRDERKFELVNGRRPAGYTIASEHSEKFDDPGFFVELPEVNKIRELVIHSGRNQIKFQIVIASFRSGWIQNLKAISYCEPGRNNKYVF